MEKNYFGTATWSVRKEIDEKDSEYINILRGFCILIIMLLHLGLSWFYSPYSYFTISFVSLFFFISGGVSFFSFLKSDSSIKYFIKRFLSLSIPFYLIGIISVFIMLFFYKNIQSVTTLDVINWITFYTNKSNSPYSIGQSWYLQALFFITIFSIPLFNLSRNSAIYISIGLVASLTICSIQFFIPIFQFFVFDGHNIFQAFSNLNIFLFGAIYYRYRDYFTSKVIFVISAILLIFILLIINCNNGEFDLKLSSHSYSPDVYYVMCSYFAIFLCLLVRELPCKLFVLLPFLKKILLFFNKNAFSIFLLHSLVIDVSEKQLGLIGVASSPIRIVTKILFVVSVTCLISPSYTYLCDFLRGKIMLSLESFGKTTAGSTGSG